jgi:hypothetical protein
MGRGYDKERNELTCTGGMIGDKLALQPLGIPMIPESQPAFAEASTNELYKIHDNYLWSEPSRQRAISVSEILINRNPCLHHFHRHIRSHMIETSDHPLALETIAQGIQIFGVDNIMIDNIGEIIAKSADSISAIEDRLFSRLWEESESREKGITPLLQAAWRVKKRFSVIYSDSFYQKLSRLNDRIQGYPRAEFYACLLSSKFSNNELKVDPKSHDIESITRELSSNINASFLYDDIISSLQPSEKNYDSESLISWEDEKAGLMDFNAVWPSFRSASLSAKDTKKLIRITLEQGHHRAYVSIYLCAIIASFNFLKQQERIIYCIESGIYDYSQIQSLLILKYLLMAAPKSTPILAELSTVLHKKAKAKASHPANLVDIVNCQGAARVMHLDNSARELSYTKRSIDASEDTLFTLAFFGQIRRPALPMVLDNLKFAVNTPKIATTLLSTWNTVPAAARPLNMNMLHRLIGVERFPSFPKDVEQFLGECDYNTIQKICEALPPRTFESTSTEDSIPRLGDCFKPLYLDEGLAESCFIQEVGTPSSSLCPDISNETLDILRRQFKMWFQIKYVLDEYLSLEESRRLDNQPQTLLLLTRNEIAALPQLFTTIQNVSNLIRNDSYDLAIDTESAAHTLPPIGGVGDRFILMTPKLASRLVQSIPFSFKCFLDDRLMEADERASFPGWETYIHHAYIHYLIGKHGLSCYFLPTDCCGGLYRGREELDIPHGFNMEDLLLSAQ